jgi:Xaa-Pro dipeptidase
MASELLDIAGVAPTSSKKRRLNTDIAPIHFQVDYKMHALNRTNVVNKLKILDPSLTTKNKNNSIILMQGGISRTRNETDHELLFRQESSFQYLFGVREPDCYGSINISDGTSILYVPRLPSTYVIFMGEIHSLEWFRNRYGVDRVHYVDEMDAILRAFKPHTLYLNHGPNTDSGEYAKPASFSGLQRYKQNLGELYRSICECRMIKNSYEIDILRFVNDASSDAHIEVMKRASPGMAEYQLESLFRHFSYFRYGCRLQAYTSICGCKCFFFFLFFSTKKFI